MSPVKDFAERARKLVGAYIATSHTGFDARTTFGLMSITALLLWPFAAYHLINGNIFLTIIVGGLAALATAIAVQTRLRDVAPPFLMLAACLLGNIVVFEAVVHLKLIGIFWVFPVIIFNYSLVGTRAAVFFNFLLCLSVSLYAGIFIAESSQLVRLVTTMAATAFFSHIFSSNIDRQKQALFEIATIDPLTGVRNRRELRADMLKACRQQSRAATPVALLVIDIDHFKAINDTHGHAKGDEALIGIAQLVTKRLRATDVLYRYGGEEFLVLAAATDLEGGRQLAEELRQSIKDATPGGLSGIRISVGVAAYAGPEPIDEWLRRGDEALYRAKANGRDRVELAGPSPAAQTEG